MRRYGSKSSNNGKILTPQHTWYYVRIDNAVSVWNASQNTRMSMRMLRENYHDTRSGWVNRIRRLSELLNPFITNRRSVCSVIRVKEEFASTFSGALPAWNHIIWYVRFVEGYLSPNLYQCDRCADEGGIAKHKLHNFEYSFPASGAAPLGPVAGSSSKTTNPESGRWVRCLWNFVKITYRTSVLGSHMDSVLS